MFVASSELASVMEFGFYSTTGRHLTAAILEVHNNRKSKSTIFIDP